VEAHSGIFLFLTLYDLDARDFVTGGGVLDSGDATDDGGERIVVVPEAGRRYLVGVTSFDVGSYSISITNDGTLTAH
jgi:hypothetical protein